MQEKQKAFWAGCITLAVMAPFALGLFALSISFAVWAIRLLIQLVTG